jgi:hypothetical protein
MVHFFILVGVSSTVLRIASALLLLWTLIYAVVCFRFISKEGIDISPQVPVLNNIYSKILPKFSPAVNHVTENIVKSSLEHAHDLKRSVTSLGPHTNPFLSKKCAASYGSSVAPSRSVSVIIPIRNEDMAGLVATLLSIALNSGSFLEEVIVVDDASREPLSEDRKEWADIRSKLEPAALLLVRAHTHLGVSEAKVGIQLLFFVFKSDPPFSHIYCIFSSVGRLPALDLPRDQY